MTPKEQTRLQVLNSLLAEDITLDQAATVMGLSPRHARRMLTAYQDKGASALTHGLRGQRPHNDPADATKDRVLRLARTRYAGTNHTHLSELLSEREGIDIARTTLRRILVNAGLISSQRRRPPQHRVRRQRMPREGMLIQLDGSYHPWLGDGRPKFTLLIAVGDATGCVVNASFSEKEDARSYFLLIQGLVQRCGIPLALYTDRHGVFRHKPGSGLAGTSSQFSRAMDELGIQMIFALSPQAQGRVERAAGTFQNRLATEFRLSGASSIGAATSVLEQFLPRFNRRFAAPPRYPEPAFRPLDLALYLEQTLCFKHSRKAAKDNTVRFHLHTPQLLPGPDRPSYAGTVVESLIALDGRLAVRCEGHIIPAQEALSPAVFLRNGGGSFDNAPIPHLSAGTSAESWGETLAPLDTMADEAKDSDSAAEGVAPADKSPVKPARNPTFLQKARWKAVEKARLKGMSLRAIERELGIHRSTIKKYLDAEGPPTRRSPATPPAPPDAAPADAAPADTMKT